MRGEKHQREAYRHGFADARVPRRSSHGGNARPISLFRAMYMDSGAPPRKRIGTLVSDAISSPWPPSLCPLETPIRIIIGRLTTAIESAYQPVSHASGGGRSPLTAIVGGRVLLITSTPRDPSIQLATPQHYDFGPSRTNNGIPYLHISQNIRRLYHQEHSLQPIQRIAKPQATIAAST